VPGKDINEKAVTPAPEKGGRAFMALVVIFIAAFEIATFAQVKAHRDAGASNIAAAHASATALVAERVNTNLALATGAMTGALEQAQAHGGANTNAQSLVESVARANAVSAAAVASAGAITAISDRRYTTIVRAAIQNAHGATLWIGAPDLGVETPTAPTIVRTIDDQTIVSVIDPAQLLPALDPSARIMIADDAGAVIYGAEAFNGAAPRSVVEALREHPSAIIRDDLGAHWVAADARAQLGGFHILILAPAPSDVALWLAALLRFALVAAAPLAATGVLYILMRQSRQRARFAEAEVVRAETHFRIAADGAKVGVIEWRPVAGEVQLSEQAANLLGAAKDVLELHELLDLVIGEDRFGVEEEFRRARITGLLDARFRVLRGASLGWIEVRGAAVEDVSGRLETRVFGTVIDSTQRYEAEARVSRLERQFRAAIENFSGPFALWDQRRRLLLWNQSFANAFKLGPDILRLRASYEAIAAASIPAIRREKHEPDNPDVRIIELATGEWLHIVERRAADGGMITIGVDITPLKRQEQELARNEKRLSDALTRAESQEYRIKALAKEAHEERQKAEEASRAKSTFLANMSHELRTPLNAVIGFSEIMAKELFGPIGNEQYKQYSSDIYDSGNHLLDLINDILDMAKIEANKFTLTPRPLDPEVAIDQAVRLTKRKAEDKGLSIVVDAQDLTEIEADHRAVKQILLNLLSNAVKFTDEGAIMVHARGTPAGLTFRVVDTGCGIPPEHLPRLARPFEQVEQELTRNNSGTGLGLALTKSLTEMHGGKLSIQSEVGRGTIVTVSLPRTFGGNRPIAAAAE
jgi:two-component system cell cycle sensor histidine kinase PleC